ncbi:hypothetical protein BJ508DRAFT_309973 [Ascobolus immersus RN42]|uniref:Uncharacterized protein n=1 Tax=Ascobolus immersus RN42 TaxID=1160509 RepID=A0A3N4HVB3_ASCIM|nr:hypothetical protein BJ508DRAFT_309973 [Ascobolus immersus RN42]
MGANHSQPTACTTCQCPNAVKTDTDLSSSNDEDWTDVTKGIPASESYINSLSAEQIKAQPIQIMFTYNMLLLKEIEKKMTYETTTAPTERMKLRIEVGIQEFLPLLLEVRKRLHVCDIGHGITQGELDKRLDAMVPLETFTDLEDIDTNWEEERPVSFREAILIYMAYIQQVGASGILGQILRHFSYLEDIKPVARLIYNQSKSKDGKLDLRVAFPVSCGILESVYYSDFTPTELKDFGFEGTADDFSIRQHVRVITSPETDKFQADLSTEDWQERWEDAVIHIEEAMKTLEQLCGGWELTCVSSGQNSVTSI